MPVIQVFIATHNRPKLVINAIQSVLKQKCDSFEVIVSDNSTNEDTDESIRHIEDGRLIYKRRIPALSPADHFNSILHDVTAEYFMIFHDDDIMHHDMLQRLYENIISDKDILAVGGNAKIITPDIFPNRVMLRNKKKNLLVSNRDQMAHQYLIKRGIVPFPSYLYRKEVAKELRFDTNHGGKHSDVAFLLDIASMGKVLMMIEPLMDYFISPGQDSKTNEFLHRIRLINYIKKTTIYKNNSYLVKRFRIVNLYYELRQDGKNKYKISGKRRRQILKLILKVSPFDFFPRSLLHFIIS